MHAVPSEEASFCIVLLGQGVSVKIQSTAWLKTTRFYKFPVALRRDCSGIGPALCTLSHSRSYLFLRCLHNVHNQASKGLSVPT